MPVLADDEVVVHRDAKRACDLDDRLRHLDVRARGGRIAGRVIVRETTVSLCVIGAKVVALRRWRSGA